MSFANSAFGAEEQRWASEPLICTSTTLPSAKILSSSWRAWLGVKYPSFITPPKNRNVRFGYARLYIFKPAMSIALCGKLELEYWYLCSLVQIINDYLGKPTGVLNRILVSTHNINYFRISYMAG